MQVTMRIQAEGSQQLGMGAHNSSNDNELK